MLSNKLTFSLTSLIVLLMVALCLPVDAQRIQATTVITLPLPVAGAVTLLDKGEFTVFGAAATPGTATGAGLDLPAASALKTVVHTDTKGRYVPAPAVFNATVADSTTVHPSTTAPQNATTAPLAAGIDVDLEEFFRLGGTIELIAPADGDDENFSNDPIADFGLGKHDLIISEVMWALDIDGDATTANDRRQWIEIFAAKKTKEIANITGDFTTQYPTTNTGRLKLRFVPYYHLERPGDIIPASAGITANGGAPGAAGANPAVKHIILDSVSNLQFVRWNVEDGRGQNGNTTPPRATQSSDPALAPLASMFRKIDYKHTKLPAEGVPNGALPGSWAQTPANGRRNVIVISGRNDLLHATAGARHVLDVVYKGVVTATSIASDSVVINEVRNDTSAENVDWVELYNAGTTPVDLHGWELSLIDATHDPAKDPVDPDRHANTDTMLVGKEDGGSDADRFPKGADWKLEPGDYLLIVNRHPKYTPLAGGVNIDEVAARKEVKAGAMHQYIVREKLNLPAANITLLLRDNLEKNATHKGVNSADAKKRALTDTTPSANLKDYAGNVSFEVKTNEYNTLVWPFRGWAEGDKADGEAIPANRTQSHARTPTAEGVYGPGHHKDRWAQHGSMGGVGYDRGVDLKYAPGTPGYANDSVRTALIDDKATRDTADDVEYDGKVSISEIMFDAGPRWNQVQWIELYNSSMYETINLKGWELQIRNAKDDVESYVDSGFVFEDAYILPNQTLLVVSGSGTTDVADNRVYNLYQNHRRDLGLTNRRSVLLSPAGFYLKLVDKNEEPVDEAGNVEVDGANRTVMWPDPVMHPEGLIELFPSEDDNTRKSIVRQYGGQYLTIDDAPGPEDASPGTMMDSWAQSLPIGAGTSFYGHISDIGTPGYRTGGPLPVSLSKFRPVRNQATGHVDIQWITESELNNAGFNILRSETKNGEYKVINVKGIIAGHGTTSEKHVYTFTDTTAKLNVVYYYQIEDVSVNGLRTTLTTTHLRGHVGAAGKLTTRWGELKSSK